MLGMRINAFSSSSRRSRFCSTNGCAIDGNGRGLDVLILSRTPDGEDGHLGGQIRQEANFAVATQEDLAFNGPVLLAAEKDEVIDGKEMEVRRFIPVIGKERR